MRNWLCSLLIGVILLAGCKGSSAKGAKGDKIPLFTTIFHAMRTYGIEDGENARGAVTQRPWLVDVRSFVEQGKRVVGPDLRDEDVAASVPAPFRPATVKSAIRCRGSDGPCRVRGDAFHMRLDSLMQSRVGVVAIVTYRWTDRRPSGFSAIGFTQRRLLLKLVDGRWVIAESKILSIS